MVAHTPKNRQGHHQGLQGAAPGEVVQEVLGELGDGEDVDEVEEELELGDVLLLARGYLQVMVGAGDAGHAGYTVLSAGRQSALQYCEHRGRYPTRPSWATQSPPSATFSPGSALVRCSGVSGILRGDHQQPGEVEAARCNGQQPQQPHRDLEGGSEQSLCEQALSELTGSDQDEGLAEHGLAHPGAPSPGPVAVLSPNSRMPAGRASQTAMSTSMLSPRSVAAPAVRVIHSVVPAGPDPQKHRTWTAL